MCTELALYTCAKLPHLSVDDATDQPLRKFSAKERARFPDLCVSIRETRMVYPLSEHMLRILLALH